MQYLTNKILIINEINENSLVCGKSICNSQPYIKNNYGYTNSINYINLVKNSYNILNTIRNELYDAQNSINKKLEKLIDTLVWWIPIRKWRDNFRNKFFDKFMGLGDGFKFIYPLYFRLNLN